MNFLSLGQHERLGLGKISHRKRFVKKSKKSQFYLFGHERWVIFGTSISESMEENSPLNFASSLNWLFECCRHLLSLFKTKRGGAAIYTDFNNGGLLEWIMRPWTAEENPNWLSFFAKSLFAVEPKMSHFPSKHSKMAFLKIRFLWKN